jgi:hypothetical protein
MESAGRIPAVFSLDAKRTGHAEMADDGKAVIEVKRQIFRTATERLDPMPGQAFHKMVWKREAQIGSVLIDTFDGCPFHEGLQAATNGFYLWQFWH